MHVHAQHAWNSFICFSPSIGARFLTLQASRLSHLNIKKRVPTLGGKHYFNFKGWWAMTNANAILRISLDKYNVFEAHTISFEVAALERTTRIRRHVRQNSDSQMRKTKSSTSIKYFNSKSTQPQSRDRRVNLCGCNTRAATKRY